jgi:hypothetical protein
VEQHVREHDLTPRSPQECVLLLLGSPREVLARIVPGDPLGMRSCVSEALRGRALLLDGERVLLRALALVAHRAAAWRGRPQLGTWLEERVEEAIAAALDEAGAGESAAPATDPHALFAAPLGLDPAELRAGCARFNRLPFERREPFYRIALEGLDPQQLSRRRGLTLGELGKGAREALDLLLGPEPVPALGTSTRKP